MSKVAWAIILKSLRNKDTDNLCHDNLFLIEIWTRNISYASYRFVNSFVQFLFQYVFQSDQWSLAAKTWGNVVICTQAVTFNFHLGY
jgi:hypothetical protein